jgi:predicted aminopeptidase
MNSEFRDLKSNYSDMAVYDAWFNYPLNNAQLISVATYHDWVPAFGKILSECGGNLEKFYEKCGQLAKKNPAERNRILEQYDKRTTELSLQGCRK